ncbi:acyltransferase family protein [Pseudoxanthomonas spadix]|jgi:acyltransferase|uniref:Exopolysaccharide xanthan biosynthesis acetyltransferase GumF n=1 Tax=Pseudoxanthomonas spadix (strain BD-a59) TaxID=1045855 RepID=G7UR88_PSEUP|nr:acyltransferase family protein [Pseudoxanthomonas spadix]AER55899.1 exopolysaccharide xanthan biosynthesis acetyltransferase GumF [Pseudoxanthomonas spadix BD-a59]MBP3974101.1 acyltransferase family protein [Pseudoxanthomonas spadix]RMW96312.1 polysaccharide biosynthesis protein GumF [Pseudoxanthomonas spadix]
MSSDLAARDLRIDAAKALAIMLVVMGHARGIPHLFTILVYSFHVPLFFVLSGWVSRAHGTARGLGETALRLARTLLLPYVVFYLLGYGYWLVTRHVGEKAARWGALPWWDPLKGLVSGIGPDLYVNPVLWFLPVLFVTTLAAIMLRRVPAGLLVLLSMPVAALWILVFPPLGVRLPFGLDVMPIALAFYALGAWMASRSLLPKEAWLNVIFTLVLVVPWMVLALRNGRVDVNALEFGQSVGLFFVNAILGTLLTLFVARLVAQASVLQWIGRNTLLILCTHILVFFVLSGVASLAGLYSEQNKPGPGWALLVSLVAMGLALPMRWVFVRIAPWAIGLSRAGGR